MSTTPRKLKRKVITTGRKIGLLLAEDGPADQAVTRGATLAANLINDSERQFKKAAREARTAVDGLRARIHAATAPGPKGK
ncbi:MAG TPA: hypothetical protein VG734_17655 [Lacunisphaera sp.]|nr:hypothetical protein [Lacunisphaera sp.]